MSFKRGLHAAKALPITLFLAATSVAFASGQGDAPDIYQASGLPPLESYPIVSEPIVLSALIVGDDLANSRYMVTDYLFELTNVDVDYTVVPRTEFHSRLHTMLGSGDVPDMIPYHNSFLSHYNQVPLIEQGIIKPINELIDQQAVSFSTALDTVGGLRSFVTAPDGQIYMMASIRQDITTPAFWKNTDAWWINRQWLENLGLQMPNTVEDYHTVMRAFRNNDANANGDPNDEWPMTTMSLNLDIGPWWIDGQLMNPFQINNLSQGRWIIDDTGKPLAAFTTDEYRDGLRWLNELWQEGLIAPDSFSRSIDDTVAINDTGDGIARFGSLGGPNWNVIGNPQAYGNASVVWQYDAMPPLLGPSGQRLTQTSTLPFVSGPIFTSTDAKTLAIAVRYIDWFYSDEGSVVSEFGFKDTEERSSKYGTWYTSAWSGSVGPSGEPATLHPSFPTSGTYFDLQSGQQLLSIIPPLWANKGRQHIPAVYPPIYQWYHDATKDLEPYRQSPERTFPPLYYSPDEFGELRRIQAQIMPFVRQSVVDFVTGRRDIDSDWDAYIEELSMMGLKRAAEINEQAYQNLRVSYAKGAIPGSSNKLTTPPSLPLFGRLHTTNPPQHRELLPSPTFRLVADLEHLMGLRGTAPTVERINSAISTVLNDATLTTRTYYGLPGRGGVVIITEFQQFDCDTGGVLSGSYDRKKYTDGCYRMFLFVLTDPSPILDESLSIEGHELFRFLLDLSTDAPDIVPRTLPKKDGSTVLDSAEIMIMVYQFVLDGEATEFIAEDESTLGADVHVTAAGLETLMVNPTDED